MSEKRLAFAALSEVFFLDIPFYRTFPTGRRRSGWKSGKPKAGFPLSHRAVLSLSQKQNTSSASSVAVASYRLLTIGKNSCPRMEKYLTPIRPERMTLVCKTNRGQLVALKARTQTWRQFENCN